MNSVKSPVGQSVPVVDSASRVTGSVDFVLNMDLPGMTFGRIKRSDVPHGRLRSIDVSGARALPGVFAVATAGDIQHLTRSRMGRFLLDQTVLATDRVRYVGEPVAAVAAIDEETAAEACDLIDIDYEPLPAVFTLDDALRDGAPLLHDPRPSLRPDAAHMFTELGPPSNICSHFSVEDGFVANALNQAEWVIEETYETPPVQHVPLETHVSLAAFDGRLTVWSSTQMPHAIRAQLAELFEVPFSAVRIVTSNIGGGFGAKGSLRLEPIAAVLAMLAGRPVKLHLPREEEFVTVTRHGSKISIASGVDRDGILVARKVVAYYNTGAYADVGPMVARNAGSAITGPYRIPNVAVDSHCVWTNLVPAGAFRGFGVMQGAWAYESHMDSIARHIGMDPVELRSKNFLRSGDRFMTGEVMNDIHVNELLAEVVQAIQSDHEEDSNGIADHKRRGRGYATVMKATITPSSSSSAIRVNQDGSIQVLTSSVDLGQGVKTALAQIAAESMRVPLERVQVSTPDTDTTPYDQQTSSSRTTFSMGNAVMEAARDAKRQLLELAAKRLEALVEDLVLDDGAVVVRGDPSSRVDYGDLISNRGLGELLGSGSFVTEGGLDPVSGKGVASVHWHQGAAGCEIEVDVETGKIEVTRLVSSVFAGRVVNPSLAELQVEGSVLFGLGQALFEEIQFDNGRVINSNLSDYLVPAFLDVPAQINAVLSEGGEEIHGVGETALPTVCPAISNALADAIGVRVYQVPLSPDLVLRAIDEQQRGAGETRTTDERVTA